MEIQTRKIDYKVGDRTHEAYLAFDESGGASRPGVIVLHEWWGVNDYIAKRTHMLAELGYVALAIDLYGAGKVAADPGEAATLMNAVLGDMDQGTQALRAGYQLLLDQPRVDPQKTAAIGYCFGGAMALHMARIGLPLKSVVSFHCALGSFHQAEPGTINPRVLVCHGAADSMVTMDDVATCKAEMDAAGADYEVLLYADAKHGFSSQKADENARKYQLDVGYNAVADGASWTEMKARFSQAFA